MGLDGKYLSEMKALEALRQLLRDAEVVRRLHEEAGMAVPPMLTRLFASEQTNGVPPSSSRPKMSVTPLPEPPRPPEAKDDWVAIPISELTITTLLLAVLREHGSPMSSAERLKELSVYRPDINFGSTLNVGARLQGTLIEKSDAGWRLTDSSQAPILFQEHAWGPIGLFQPPERTVLRRGLILHILRAAPGPLQANPILNLMRTSSSCKATINKDVVKQDLEALRLAGKIRGVGRPRRWELVTED